MNTSRFRLPGLKKNFSTRAPSSEPKTGPGTGEKSGKIATYPGGSQILFLSTRMSHTYNMASEYCKHFMANSVISGKEGAVCAKIDGISMGIRRLTGHTAIPIVANRSKMVTRRTKLPFGPPKSDRHAERSLKLGRSRTVIVFKNILKFLKGVTFVGFFIAFLVDIDLGDRKCCISSSKFVRSTRGQRQTTGTTISSNRAKENNYWTKNEADARF